MRLRSAGWRRIAVKAVSVDPERFDQRVVSSGPLRAAGPQTLQCQWGMRDDGFIDDRNAFLAQSLSRVR